MSDFDRDAETTRLGRGLRSITPVVHSLEAGDFKMVVMEACVRRGGNDANPVLFGQILLCFVSAQTGRSHMIRIADPVVVDGGLDAMLIEDGWLNGAPHVSMRVRPLTIAWGRANGLAHALDFDDDNDPAQVGLYRAGLSMHHDPFGGV